MKKLITVGLLVLGGMFTTAVVAAPALSTVPGVFQGHDENSKFVIDYTDLDSMLDRLVLVTGRSTREKASATLARTGTRMKIKVNRATINEGNRFYYEIFKDNDQNLQTLVNIRQRLESIPASVSLDKFSRDEQLAYWINLYNVTILAEVAKEYPIADLNKMLNGRRSILSEKLLDVAGVPLSLDDIQFVILKHNYDANPLLVYGLYQGNIGGPSIRKQAYTGKHVYADLIDNALDFINSNRGTESRNEDEFRVSSLYQRNKAFFGASNTTLKEHLLRYLEGDQRAQLAAATEIVPDIYDWTTTDLFGSQREPAGSIANNSAALMGASIGSGSDKFIGVKPSVGRYGPAVMQHLKDLEAKQDRARTGNVTLEELGQDPESVAEDKPDADK